MKRPQPKSFGLKGQAPLEEAGAFSLDIDPEQPFTQQELHEALDALVFAYARIHRQRQYAKALGEWNYNNGGR